MLDDYSQDTFIHTPNINRIGDEGAKIKYYSTNSLCVPGRASLLTGKYGHKTDALNNDNYPLQTLVTLPKILHAQGYYTALCGKWMLGNSSPKPEFDYWLWTPNSTSYYNDSAKYFDSVINVSGHMTDFLTDSALKLISRIDTPFFLMLDYNAPHNPSVPQLIFDSLYENSIFSLPQNWPAYNVNYPSFLYSQNSGVIFSEQAFQNTIKDYYELFHGVENATGKILDSLQSNGLLENTMVIFTTDNGFLFGEHHLRGKALPYEECMRLPLFIRFPLWYQPGTLIDSSLSLNIDIAPTILEAAGIIDTFNMDGTSIHSILTNQFKRKEFLYEQNAGIADSAASVRTFRDNYFQYNQYFCSDTTEELFDLVVDPFQINNLVYHYQYQDTLNNYRFKLDSLRLALDDTVEVSDMNCYLLNPSYTNIPVLYSVSHINANCGIANGSIDVTILSGAPPFNFVWNNFSITEDLNNINAGVYHLTITDANGTSVLVNVLVNNINGPILSEFHVDATYDNADGSINLMVSGNSPPFTYLWNNGATTQDLHNIMHGSYEVTVTNNIGCISVLGVVIKSMEIQDPNSDSVENKIPDLLYLFKDVKIDLFPNPAQDIIYLTANLPKGESKIEIYNCYGVKLITASENFDDNFALSFDLKNFTSGIYFIRILSNSRNFVRVFTVIK